MQDIPDDTNITKIQNQEIITRITEYKKLTTQTANTNKQKHLKKNYIILQHKTTEATGNTKTTKTTTQNTRIHKSKTQEAKEMVHRKFDM